MPPSPFLSNNTMTMTKMTMSRRVVVVRGEISFRLVSIVQDPTADEREVCHDPRLSLHLQDRMYHRSAR
jgi:hypothetical protein